LHSFKFFSDSIFNKVRFFFFNLVEFICFFFTNSGDKGSNSGLRNCETKLQPLGLGYTMDYNAIEKDGSYSSVADVLMGRPTWLQHAAEREIGAPRRGLLYTDLVGAECGAAHPRPLMGPAHYTRPAVSFRCPLRWLAGPRPTRR
jgi:hypothetical protein